MGTTSGEVGKDIRLKVKLSNAGAHVTWLRDGAKVSAAKMETKAEGDSHSLVIKNATIEDVGEYICQAENVTSKTELEVQSKEEKIEGENIFFHQWILEVNHFQSILFTIRNPYSNRGPR